MAFYIYTLPPSSSLDPRSLTIPIYIISSTFATSFITLSHHRWRIFPLAEFSLCRLLNRTFRIRLPPARQTWPAHLIRYAFRNILIFILLYSLSNFIFILVSYYPFGFFTGLFKEKYYLFAVLILNIISLSIFFMLILTILYI